MNKKGFVYSLKATDNATYNNIFNSLNLGWYYTWGLQGSQGLNIPFTPMLWSIKNIDKLNTIPPSSSEILGFNEPDAINQSNINMSDVILNWSKLKNTGLRIGSVATAQNVLSTSYTPNDGTPVINTSYFDNVWTQLSNQNMTPDFVALHWYAPPNSIHFLQLLDNIYAKYQKPLWITEMCVADWNATTSNPEKYTKEQIQQFMGEAVKGMNSRDFVERYAWKTRPITDINMGNGALLDLNNNLTDLGKYYSSL